MKVKIKKLNSNAVIPKYAKEGDAGLDLVATEVIPHITESDLELVTVKSGLAVEIPKSYVGLLFPRSSIYKNNALLINSVGVIDSGYRGEITANFMADVDNFGYKVGDKFAQLIIIPYPQIEFEEVKELSNTERGTGGFGHTGV